MTSPAAGRPALVWIISLFYFIFIPVGLVMLLVAPLVRNHPAQTVKRSEHDLQEELAQATDLPTKNRLAGQLQRMQEERRRAEFTRGGRIGYYAYLIVTVLLAFAGAVFLFQLRLIALHIFSANFVIALIREIYVDMMVGLPHLPSHWLHIFVGFKVATWAVSLAVLIYVWHLSDRGVLN